MKNKNAFKITSIAYTVLIYLFLYVPILILIVYSFNDSKMNILWTGFTMKWYGQLLQDKSLISALQNTLIVGFASTIISTIIGTAAGVGMYRYTFKGKSVLDALLYVPIVIPEIVMGISLLSLFSIVKIPAGLITLIIAHVTFSIPFIVIVVRSRLAGFDKSMEEAAMDLGAKHFQTFKDVTLPLIMPGVLAGAMLAFTLSIDDVIISFFVSGPKTVTLPIYIFSMVRFGVTPVINALSTLMLLVTLGFVLLSEKLKTN
jgi:spermidine/putrescine transport system permease protein